jgi:hypothetical protein
MSVYLRQYYTIEMHLSISCMHVFVILLLTQSRILTTSTETCANRLDRRGLANFTFANLRIGPTVLTSIN